jgi:putative endopeptidase
MRKLFLSLTAISSFCLCLFSCNTNKGNTVTVSKTLALANIDSAVKPGDDFFLYANGKWLDTATIDPSESSAGSSIEMYNRTKAHLKSILDSVSSAKNAPGSIGEKVGDFYASGMDSAAIEKASYDPVKPTLQEINDIKDTKGIMHFLAKQITYNEGSLLAPYVAPDDKNSSVNILAFYQAGLGLPDRDYYFKTDAATANVVNAYKTYIQKIFTLTGDDSATAAKNMNTVYNIEKQLAASHRTNVELRDPQSNYNKMAVADLDKRMPEIGWKDLIHTIIPATVDSVNVNQPAYYQELNNLLKTVPVDSWKTYLRFHTLSSAAPALSNDFVQANFDYAGKALAGNQQMKQRWERIYQLTDANLGDDLGQLYVKEYFPEEAKKRMLELVNNLQKSFEARIVKLDWMSDSTKQIAKDKLHAFIKKIGFPDKWRDYSKVTIDRKSFYNNLQSCAKNEFAFQAAKVGKPVDRTEWGMTTPTINAYYNPTVNEIVFPAGILQYPYFDLGSDDAMNYGGIGMIIGHEMTHAFDDQGAQYDKDGNLKNWWSKEDYEKFKAKGQQVINLYNGFIVLDSMHLNGSLTQGENTADIGGIAIAYDAFKLTKQGQDTVKIDGLTPDQRFFLSYAQGWRNKKKDQALRTQVNTNPHSTAKYRVWGPLMNFDPFYKAFNVKEGDKMFVPQKDRIRIW